MQVGNNQQSSRLRPVNVVSRGIIKYINYSNDLLSRNRRKIQSRDPIKTTVCKDPQTDLTTDLPLGGHDAPALTGVIPVVEEARVGRLGVGDEGGRQDLSRGDWYLHRRGTAHGHRGKHGAPDLGVTASLPVRVPRRAGTRAEAWNLVRTSCNDTKKRELWYRWGTVNSNTVNSNMAYSNTANSNFFFRTRLIRTRLIRSST